MTDLIGQTLLGQFRVDAFVASGGMGAVYRVRDVERNVPLAMKVLHADLAEDPSVFKRFEREARALRKLAHPNIVPFYGLYHTLDMTFLLERYIDGPTLKEVLRTRGGEPLGVDEALVYLKALTSALGYAHAQGVVHCDVKPGNVMVDRGGQVYLTDFGVARHAESTTTTIGYAGTAAYMAPEQCRGEAVSAATDVYALGVMLHEMLTGRRPFRGDEAGTESGGATAAERIRWAHVHLAPEDPISWNPEMSEALSRVILKALSKGPEERWGRARALFEAACEAARAGPEAVADRVGLSAGVVAGEGTVREVEEVRQSASEVGEAEVARAVRRAVPWLAGAGGLVVLGGVALAWVVGGNLLFRGMSESQEAEATVRAVVRTTRAPASPIATPVFRGPPNQVPETAEPSVPAPDPLISPSPIINSLTGTGLIRVTSGSIPFFMPALSPDQSRMVAFAQIQSHWQIVELDPVHGGMLRQITVENADHYHPHFTANGDFLLVSSNRSGLFEIYLIRFDTGEVVEQLTNGPGNSMTPSWLPGEQSFVYMSDRDGDYEIYQGFRDGSTPRRLTDNSVYDGSCTVSPDGISVGFYSDQSGNPDIYIMDLRTSELARLTDSPARDAEPVFSPDGEWIAFESTRDGDYDIWAIRPDGSGLRRITNDPGSEQVPVFSPDGHWLFYQSNADGTYDIFRIPWP